MRQEEIYNVGGVSYGVPIAEEGDAADMMKYSAKFAADVKQVLLHAPAIAASGQVQTNKTGLDEMKRRTMGNRLILNRLTIPSNGHVSKDVTPLPASYKAGDQPQGAVIVASTDWSVVLGQIGITGNKLSVILFNLAPTSRIVDVHITYRLGPEH